MELFEPPPLAAMLDPDPVPGRLRKPASSRAEGERNARVSGRERTETEKQNSIGGIHARFWRRARVQK